MFSKKDADIQHINGDEGTRIKQYFHPENTSHKIKYSLVQCTLEPGMKSKLHKIKSSEIYYILEGEGVLEINKELCHIKKDDSVLVMPNSEQMIKNTGPNILKFLCIVEPAWKQSDETILE